MKCKLCGKQIRRGESIVMLTDIDVCHKQCAENERSTALSISYPGIDDKIIRALKVNKMLPWLNEAYVIIFQSTEDLDNFEADAFDSIEAIAEAIEVNVTDDPEWKAHTVLISGEKVEFSIEVNVRVGDMTLTDYENKISDICAEAIKGAEIYNGADDILDDAIEQFEEK